jgi:hypothetical protein
MMVERYSNLKEEVGGSNPGCEISSLHDGKLVKWSTISCALTLTCRHFVSKKEKRNNQLKLNPSRTFTLPIIIEESREYTSNQ